MNWDEINIAPPAMAFAIGKQWAEHSIVENGIEHTARQAVLDNAEVDSKAYFVGVLSAIGDS